MNKTIDLSHYNNEQKQKFNRIHCLAKKYIIVNKDLFYSD